MKPRCSTLPVLALLICMTGCAQMSASAPSRQRFNEGWRFARFGPMPDGSTLAEPAGLEVPDINDRTWRTLDLPHDWGVEGPFRVDLPNSTGKLPWAGIGWYRKTFTVPASDQGRRVFIDFDGAMSQARVWFNGRFIGEWPYGYSSFRLDLTDHVRFGRENVLAVRLDNPANSSRWYPGGGIYRNVWLVTLSPVHLAHWGVFVTTPEVTAASATLAVRATIDNQDTVPAEVTVRHEAFLLAEPGHVLASGEQAGIRIGPGASADAAVQLTVPEPRPWDIQSPTLYGVRTTVLRAGRAVDETVTTCGIRTIAYHPRNGFLLNGKRVQMNGVCQHHDIGPLGAAVHARALERQIEILKEMGCNAIRTSHNPPAPELLDLCDRMGMLVMDEAFDTWRRTKTPNDYGRHFDAWHERDVRALVRRDRNHPCVVMWSSGNEIAEQGQRDGVEVAQALRRIFKEEDPTRPVAGGLNNGNAVKNGFYQGFDLIGRNYKPNLYAEERGLVPDVPLFGSETASTVSSRGEYFFPVSDDPKAPSGAQHFQVSSYDLIYPGWATTADKEFAAQDRNPSVFGEFVWTGFDYIGEPTPYNRDSTNLLNFQNEADRRRFEAEMEKYGGRSPSRSSYFGIVDLCGFPKDRFYLYQARWRPDLAMAHILPHWTWPDRVGQITPVHVYTSGDEAELFLNGRSLGRKARGPYEYRLRWDDVTYEPGELKVVAYKNGKQWAQAVQRTAGPAVRLALSADRPQVRADGQDLVYLTVRVMDARGTLVPQAADRVTFTMDGPAEVIAVCNGDATSFEPFQASAISAYNGLAQAVIRTQSGKSGTVHITASAEGLTADALTVTRGKGD